MSKSEQELDNIALIRDDFFQDQNLWMKSEEELNENNTCENCNATVVTDMFGKFCPNESCDSLNGKYQCNSSYGHVWRFTTHSRH